MALRKMKITINALQYKKNSSGIGVMIREMFGAFTEIASRECNVVIAKDAPEFPGGRNTNVIRIPWKYDQSLKRLWFQTVLLGQRYGRDAVLLVTDSKMPFFLPDSCVAVPLITDLAVYRMPAVYKRSRVLLWKAQYLYIKRRANYYLTISQFSKNEIVSLLGVEPEKIYVIPCACSSHIAKVEEEEQLNRVRKKYDLPDRYILFVGNTNPRKNLNRLLKAYDMAKDKGEIAHQLIIAGDQGWKFDRELALNGVKHKKDIRFIGFVADEDMNALYSAASLFVFPTLYEGFGIPVIEAQTCGVPVLTSNVSALPEVGGDGAIYVDPYCEEDICDGILKVLQDETLRKKLVESGYQNRKRFSWKKSAEMLNDIVEKEAIK